jgi:hypothetical protein
MFRSARQAAAQFSKQGHRSMRLGQFINGTAFIFVSAVTMFAAGCNSERVAEPISKAEKERVGKEFRQAQQEAQEARKAGLTKRKGVLKQNGTQAPSEP